MRVSLKPHPTSDPGPVDRVEVHFERVNRFRYWTRFEVWGQVSQIAWPAEALTERVDGLWRKTCFEAFLIGNESYWEFNFSPSKRWASYAFDGYRSGMRPAEELVSPDQLELGEAHAEFELTFERPPNVTRLGLCAVIETVDGAISYWALAHPSDKPDFHHPQSFVLELP